MLSALGKLFLVGAVAALFGVIITVVAMSLGAPDKAYVGVVAGSSGMFLTLLIIGKANE